MVLYYDILLTDYRLMTNKKLTIKPPKMTLKIAKGELAIKNRKIRMLEESIQELVKEREQKNIRIEELNTSIEWLEYSHKAEVDRLKEKIQNISSKMRDRATIINSLNELLLDITTF